MKTVHFQEVYSKKNRKIIKDSPEILFMESICKRKANAKDFFNEDTIYGKKVFIDAPNGHYEGINEMQEFADQWLDDFKADSAEVLPVIQTRANGRSVTEMEVWFHKVTGDIEKVPMVVFGDLIGAKKMEGMRIYFFCAFLEGAIGYRKPIYRPRFNTYCEPALMTGVVRAYYEQICNFNTKEAIENIVNMVSEDIIYGGYRPDEVEPIFVGKKAIREIYTGLCNDWPKTGYIRFETLTDDNVNCIAEWTVVVRKEGLANGVVCFCGCAGYERDEEGKLCSIRICDNNGCDIGIDPRSIPADLWFVE